MFYVCYKKPSLCFSCILLWTGATYDRRIWYDSYLLLILYCRDVPSWSRNYFLRHVFTRPNDSPYSLWFSVEKEKKNINRLYVFLLFLFFFLLCTSYSRYLKWAICKFRRNSLVEVCNFKLVCVKLWKLHTIRKYVWLI